MGLYRTKQVVIEARQFTGAADPQTQWPVGLDDRNSCLRAGRDCHVNGPHVHGKQGPVRVDVGDWLIREADGSRFYPCKPDIFESKYESLAPLPATLPTYPSRDGAPAGVETHGAGPGGCGMDPRTPVGITPERAAEAERLRTLGADLSPGVRSDLGASAPDRRGS